MKNWLLIYFFATALHCSAQLGGVVIVAANPAEEALWSSEELPKWIQMLQTADAQLKKANEMVDMVGHPEQFASSILESAAPALAQTRSANALADAQTVAQGVQSGWNLYSDARALSSSTLAVPGTLQVLGDTVARDRTRYVEMATEKALRARLQDALNKKHQVDSTELDVQARAVQMLGTATTQAEIALQEAALGASKQRMEIAAARVKQAETELSAFTGDADLENRKTSEMQAEASEQFLNRIAERAQHAVDVGAAMPTAPQPIESHASAQ